MDYGNGRLLATDSDNPNEYGFHTTFSKTEMCTAISRSISGTTSGLVSPLTKAWVAFTPMCGDGIVDAALGEECDPGTPGVASACCTAQCKFTTGSTCDGASACCVSCKMQPVATPCTSNGATGRCGAGGVCTASSCGYYSNTVFCDMSPSNACSERCAFTGSTTCNVLNSNFNRTNGDLCQLGTATGM